ncbi:transporter [uncultured Sphingomonas sp.]|uniref:transporter n=1 Tax=uncultured Sphingomonas sp. TaxID=158754 RepID=UPI0035CA4B5D
MRWMGCGAMVLGLLAATPAMAADDRDYCPERPGLGTPACIVSPGRVSVETALADWTLDRSAGDRTDIVLIGDTLVRVGLTDTVEAQIGWTPYGSVRERSGGSVDRAGRVGDVTLGIKASLASPDGKGLSIAVLPFVTLPVGRMPVGAGDWGAGLVVPVTYDLNDSVNLQFTPEVDAAVDQDGNGRHVAVSGIAGLGLALSRAVTLTVEGEVLRDDDPSGKTVQGLASLSLAWMANDDLQLDSGAVAGLTRDAPDVELYVGISRRF